MSGKLPETDDEIWNDQDPLQFEPDESVWIGAAIGLMILAVVAGVIAWALS